MTGTQKRASLGRDIVLKLVVRFLLVLVLITTIYPFLYVIYASFSDPFRYYTHSGPLLWFKGFTLNAYSDVIANKNVWIGFRNSLLYTAVGVSINMTLTILGGYTLSRPQLKGRNLIMGLIVFTMIFKGGLIPNYILVRQLKMYNTLWALVLPSAINTMNLIIMRTGFSAMPKELEESARIDGAKDFTILTRIAIPVTMSTILTLTMYYAVTRWNAWFYASIYIRDRKLMPLQIFLRELLIEDATGLTDGVSTNDVYRLETYKYALIMVSTLPILIIFPFISRFFGKGVMVGAVKG